MRGAAYAVRRGVIARCPGLALTPKVTISVGKPDTTGVKVFLTCSLDCIYSVTLDARRLHGTATGKVTKTLLFRGKPAAGTHRVTAQAVASLNQGPPVTATALVRMR